jgi:dTDP-4-amino-4,6-dideoxygalactose transaminase
VSLPFLPFARPEIGDDEIAEVVDTLRSGWLTTGPKAKRFEDDFSAYLGDPALQSLAVNSATAGLHLALEALGIGPGDEVITTTHTFTATAEVVRYLGADVKLVDIDPNTLCIDPNAVAAAVGPKTRAIVPVHYGGLAADMAAILDIARRHGSAWSRTRPMRCRPPAAASSSAPSGRTRPCSASTPTRPSPPAKAAWS